MATTVYFDDDGVCTDLLMESDISTHFGGPLHDDASLLLACMGGDWDTDADTWAPTGWKQVGADYSEHVVSRHFEKV